MVVFKKYVCGCASLTCTPPSNKKSTSRRNLLTWPAHLHPVEFLTLILRGSIVKAMSVTNPSLVVLHPSLSPPGNDTNGGDAADIFAKLSMKKKPRFVKSPEDHTPLPDPFPLPAHYREDVERCLKSKNMTQPTKKLFFSAVASAMLSYKRYPSSTDYHCVYRTIKMKYTFPETESGDQEVYMYLFCMVRVECTCIRVSFRIGAGGDSSLHKHRTQFQGGGGQE